MIEGFFLYWPVGQVSRLDEELDEDVWSFAIGSKILPDIPVAIGEILHNIRSPLDQLMSLIAQKNGGLGKATYFPFSADAAGLEDQIRQKCKQLPPAALEPEHWRKQRQLPDSLEWTCVGHRQPQGTTPECSQGQRRQNCSDGISYGYLQHSEGYASEIQHGGLYG
jgi:hypothetical protein